MSIHSLPHVFISRLEQLGHLQRSGQQYRAPCPVCARGSADNALSVKLEGDKILLYCFRCESSFIDILEAVGINPRDFRASSDWTPTAPPQLEPDEQRRAKLERIWKAAFPLNGIDHASQYLERRGLTLERYPSNLRYTHIEYWENSASMGIYPVMLSRIQNPLGELVSLHQTYLDPNGGGKAKVGSPKKIMTPIHSGATMGAAVRLSSVTDHLAVTEGIETGLAVQQLTRLATWAAVSAGGLEQVVWPPSIKILTICADHDPRGIEAAHTLARRALEAGLLVRLAVPPLKGLDWLDMMLSERQAAVL